MLRENDTLAFEGVLAALDCPQTAATPAQCAKYFRLGLLRKIWSTREH
jgi:hypothetical protein